MKKYITYLSLGTLFLISSCEEMLEVDLPQNQISSEQVFSDKQTAYAALAGLYSGLYDNSPLSGDNAGKLLGVYTDDLNYYSMTASLGTVELFNNTQRANNTVIASYWSGAYQQVYVANSILDGLARSTALSSADKDQIRGEVLLIRSILFFYLQQSFGDIPMPSVIDYRINQNLSKKSSADVLELLRSDLLESIQIIRNDYRHTDRIFANRKVAELMLAKVYMAQNKWSDAEALLKTIVQSNLYVFQNDITKVFTKSSTHVLWQLKPLISADGTKEAILYYFANAAPTSFALSSDLINSFSSVDIRKQNWIAEVKVGANTWYRTDKYKLRSANTTEFSIIFRLEEVYLLLAEALAQQNKIVESLPYVNATRTRAKISVLTQPIDRSILLNEILLEWRREFFTETGHRFFDLKRFGRLEDLKTTKPNWATYQALWPLPEREILMNPNLNPQNNGY
ncbi:RagB/SusD family nutrient uptake outer membrane protein [Epilithonimonas ginsengisoli]|uniref:RagB/SusD family nutrient uptake outer membrane protein n=1 Tax=Epilithonimonas ginsengisoli TaxID=1245592 RepID=A0ABU4JK37_9FLAO|nr:MULTISPECIES: RagB/SusD family nutrient uptake outer membrane protein [Chryseobacterium group]MBV6880456.1 RagB/SusD family nutrient uptake outer membrane protein [Epilithonimonas sp. FP105]MDW8550027.1 RagB/SusD family nutrient uptake outer membrane protein [Epilithonimonas ginsengisoli]OAH69207.1 glycan metabolism protein RagB [Chryseobacterium sp. FP211-J200]